MPRRVFPPLVGATVALVLTAGVAAGCGGSSGSETQKGPATLRVPEKFSTIQAAVDAAKEGDLVLISPGTYTESVTVETPGIVIRGLDRNTTILKGDGQAENGIKVFSDRVAVENLTIRDYRSNGLLFGGSYGEDDFLKGYRASYITVHNNGLYGVYGFTAQGGMIDHVYASGQRDGGVYIGQCQPCNTVVTDVVAENNAVGYMGTNSGGDLYVVNSVFSNNRVGVQPNAANKEELPPGVGLVVAGNVINNNNNPDTPKATNAIGVGVGIGGAHNTEVLNNRIEGNQSGGVLVSSNENFDATGTVVKGNQLANNGVDLAVISPRASKLCFADNQFAESVPDNVETAWPCSGTAKGGSGVIKTPSAPDGIDPVKLAEPPEQDNMPKAATAKPVPATATVKYPDIDAIKVPQ